MAVLISLIFPLLLGVWLFETKWPPQVEDNELSRIGPPLIGAEKIGHPITFSGSVTCIDECLVRAQSYSAAGTLAEFQSEATHALIAKGYSLESNLACVQYGYPTLRLGHWMLDCTINASDRKFYATMWATFQRTSPLVATTEDQYHPPAPPLGLTFSLKDGDYTFVSVGMSH